MSQTRYSPLQTTEHMENDLTSSHAQSFFDSYQTKSTADHFLIPSPSAPPVESLKNMHSKTVDDLPLIDKSSPSLSSSSSSSHSFQLEHDSVELSSIKKVASFPDDDFHPLQPSAPPLMQSMERQEHVDGGDSLSLPHTQPVLLHSSSSSSSSSSSEEVCRICYDIGQENNPLFRPCHCTSFIHHSCLDTWRSAHQNPKAFTTCEVCKFEYVITNKNETLSQRRKRKVITVLLCVADFLYLFGIFQAFSCAIALFLSAVDGSASSIDQQTGTRSRPLGHFMGNNTDPYLAYWLLGMAIFLFITGLVTLLYHLCGRETIIWADAGPCECGNCHCNCNCCCEDCPNLCRDCRCHDCRCGNDCGEAGAVVLIAIVIAIICFGAFVCILYACDYLRVRASKRFEIRKKLGLATVQVVQDIRELPDQHA